MKFAEESFKTESTTKKPKTHLNKVQNRRYKIPQKKQDKQHEESNQEAPIKKHKKQRSKKDKHQVSSPQQLEKTQKKLIKKGTKKKKKDTNTSRNNSKSKYLPTGNNIIFSDSDDSLSPIIIKSQVEFLTSLNGKTNKNKTNQLTNSEADMQAYLADIFNSEIQDLPTISQFFSTEKKLETSYSNKINHIINTGESTCSCFTEPDHEQTECCASDNCFGMHYELSCSDKDTVFKYHSTGSFSPCIDAKKASSNDLPEISSNGQCCDNICNACTTLTSCLPSLEQVTDCVPQIGTQCINVIAFLGDGVECLFDLVGCYN